MEAHESAIGVVREPLDSDLPFFIDVRGHRACWIHSEVKRGVRGGGGVYFHRPVDSSEADREVHLCFAEVSRTVGGESRVGMAGVHLLGPGRRKRLPGNSEPENYCYCCK